jgi:preprotein translocase subunit SecE
VAGEPNGSIEPEDAVSKPSGDDLGEKLIDPKAHEISASDLADDVAELDETTELVRQAVAARPVKRERANAPVKKDAPTSKRDVKSEEESGASPVTFVKQSVAELKKTVWPSGDDVKQYFIVVLIFVLFVMTIVAGLDFLFGWGILKWLG